MPLVFPPAPGLNPVSRGAESVWSQYLEAPMCPQLAQADAVLVNQSYSGISDSVIDQWYLEIVHPPMGLAYIAGYLRKQGVSVDIIDANALQMTATAVADAVKESKPVLVGINSTTPAMFDCRDICKAIRQAAPDAFLVVGGNHATTFPELTLREIPEVDAVVLYDGEVTFHELAVEAKAHGRKLDRSKVQGIGFLQADGTYVKTATRPLVNNLDEFGLPARDLLPNDRYRENFYTGHGLQKFTNIFINRGCPYECIFCDAPVMHGRKLRARSVPMIMAELEDAVNKYGVHHVFFFDDTFTLSRDRVMQLCKEIIDRKLDLTWKTETRVDLVDPELLALMKKAGCVSISFGVESGSDRVLKVIKKAHDIAAARRGIQMCKDAGISVVIYIIIGFLGDDEQSVQETIQFARDSGADYALFSRMIPLPGTQLFERMAGANQIKTELLGNWPIFQLYGGASVVRHPSLSDEQINEFLHKAYREFYMRPSYMMKRLFNTRSLNEFKTLLAGARIVFSSTRGPASAGA